MDEIRAIPWNGMNAISLFCGAGGSSLGYRMAGFKVLWASEFIDAAREVYEANAAPGTIVDGRDIREVDPLDVLRTLKLKPGELDVLDGSPPCASFSTAGKREKHWGTAKKYSDKVQRTDDLFFEYVRFLKAIQPKVFVAENVSGLVKGTAKGYFLQILRAMKACGYRVEASLLDAQWLGVPQTRQRIIFQGVREDLGVAPAYPTPLPYRYSVRDALPWIAGTSFSTGGQNQACNPRLPPDAPAHSITAGAKNATHHLVEPRIVQGNGSGHSSNRGNEVPLDRPLPSVNAGSKGSGPHQFYVEARIVPGDRGNRRRREEGKPHSLDEPLTSVLADGGRNTNRAQFMVETETDISKQAIGREYDKLNPGQQSEKYFSLVRADAGEPSPTVTAAGGQNSGIACVVHPSEKRKFSIAELKRICAFSDDFKLSGSYAQQWERLGRAVPPVMMFYLARTIRDEVFGKCAVQQSSGSGLKSTSAAPTSAGPGRRRPTQTATATSTSAKVDTRRRTSSRSKKSSGGV